MAFELPINQIIQGDCLKVMRGWPDKCVDLIVTSPPYAEQRDYGGMEIDWDTLMIGATSQFARVIKDDGQILINLGQIHRDGEVWFYWEHWLIELRMTGLRLFGLYVWDQGDGLPGNWNGRLAPSHEWIFHLNHTARQPHKIIRTKEQRSASGTGLRKKNGDSGRLSSPDKCGQPFKIPDSVIRIYREMGREDVVKEHPARYPVELPSHIIQSYSDPDTIILDPFAGSGTTLVAAKQLGRKYIGIEISEKYVAICKERLKQEQLPL